MVETVIFTDRQKAIIGAISAQFEKNLAMGLLRYDPIEAHSYLVKTGDFSKYKLGIPEQFEVLAELSALDLPIQIDISENEYNPTMNCLTDALHRTFCITDDSSDLEREAFEIKRTFGTVFIVATIDGMEEVKALCRNDYIAELVFADSVNYHVKCCLEGQCENYHFPPLHAGKRPQLIIKCAMDNKGKELSRRYLNERVLKRSGATLIGRGESILSSVLAHDKASLAVFSYFFDITPGSITYNGSTRTDLSVADIGVFKKYCIKH